jgi:hypothetical protein
MLLQSGREDLGWMFCPYSGYMLEFDPIKGVATCPQSGYSRRLEGAITFLWQCHSSVQDLQLVLKAPQAKP